ncbi:baseplate J/gp47 family protein [Clostridium botulinum]|uniref:baseplate J/gp47 family protein n=1 Tax=Clostridium botulinum TaxID=1491 RepID=UPI000773FC7A|nr:baseplate J/gp47 family protein [Clostridium botulinum]NFH81661.1 baseplate J/gp47 family protein [Clostridium botulinum]NFH84877.1 baseplate J/gp47 family protein [Clostridium botulinum]NFI12900.1 baseplate J/gp47 family protein [Clostridium botulinum]NFI16082.1 baseplate J/gp47 family protein [Clostridium botulinum]NFO85901.1 baseplate J/gp47 family protein [Clostridium botulinum]
MAYYRSAEDVYNEMFLGYTATNTEEGSLIYNACMPVCMKLSQALLNLDEATKKVFASSAVESGYSSYLERRIKEVGIERKQATYASTKIDVNGSPNASLKANSIVGIKDNRLYITQSDLVLDQEGHGKINIKAEKPGSKYNAKSGEINYLPIKYTGIVSINNKEAITNGYDIESNEDLYNRYLLKVQTPATSGNKYHYEQWAREIIGVGFAKCIPSPGYVKVIITDSNKRAANKELIKECYEHIDNVRPLLAGTLEVVTVTELNLNITANVEIDSSVVLGDIQNLFINEIQKYINDIVFKSKKISIAKLGGLLIGLNGVIDYSNLKINNSSNNITLGEDEIAVLGTVTLGVM